MLGIHPLTKPRVKQWLPLSALPLFITGGWVDFVSVSGRNECSLILVGASERCLWNGTKKNSFFWEAEQRQAGYHCRLPLEHEYSVFVQMFKCFLTHSVSWYQSIHLPEKDNFRYYCNKLHRVALCHRICRFWHETVKDEEKCTELKKDLKINRSWLQQTGEKKKVTTSILLNALCFSD